MLILPSLRDILRMIKMPALFCKQLPSVMKLLTNSQKRLFLFQGLHVLMDRPSICTLRAHARSARVPFPFMLTFHRCTNPASALRVMAATVTGHGCLHEPNSSIPAVHMSPLHQCYQHNH